MAGSTTWWTTIFEHGINLLCNIHLTTQHQSDRIIEDHVPILNKL